MLGILIFFNISNFYFSYLNDNHRLCQVYECKYKNLSFKMFEKIFCFIVVMYLIFTKTLLHLLSKINQIITIIQMTNISYFLFIENVLFPINKKSSSKAQYMTTY